LDARAEGNNLRLLVLVAFALQPLPVSAPVIDTERQAALLEAGRKIASQIQPCADRVVNPGPGANRIVTAVRLSFNRDGTLAYRPQVVSQFGIDDENRQLADRMADLAVAAVVACLPLRDIPEDLYDGPAGLRTFTLRYRLPG
jgi:hypothetical protein